MNSTPAPRGARRPAVLLFLLACAVLVGVGIGAVAYRTWQKQRAEAPAAEAEPKAEAAQTTIPPGDPALATPAGDVSSRTAKPGDRFAAQFATDSLFPRFHPNRHYYVTRCVPGKTDVHVKANDGATVTVSNYPPETGRFKAQARVMPGQAFNVITEVDGKTSTYEVRCLPDDFPQWGYKRLAKDLPKGMFLISFRPRQDDYHRSWMIAFDQEGTPHWWLSPATNTLGGQILPDKTVQYPRGFGDGFGRDPRTGIEIRSLDGSLRRMVRFKGAPTDGHEYTRLPNGNAYIMSYKPRYGVDLSSVGGKKDVGVLDGAIQEVTPSGKVVWSWSSKDHVKLSDTPDRWWKRILVNPHNDVEGRPRYDIFHLNSIEPWRGQLVLSTRHTDRVWGIDRKTGKVLWTFGGNKGPKSLKIEGNDPFRSYPIAGNHDARMEGDVLSIHDNGTLLGRPPRAVFYRIDLKNRTATYIGESRDVDAAPDSHCCGGVRRFGDGWIVAWGNNPYITGFNSENEKAFRLSVTTPVYRAVPVPPEVTAEDLNRAMSRMAPKMPPPKEPVLPITRY